MTKAYVILILVLTLFLNACKPKKLSIAVSDLPTIESPYFGQKTPDLIP